MDTRSKVAASVASVVPFNCIICFEEFTATERPPMVLPCGHTYVCLPCSKRLRRCMECREPMFIRQPATEQQQQTPSRGGRYGYSPGTPPHNHAPPPASNNIPLPIPKNLVLLAMMEAAERLVVRDKEAQQPAEDDSSSSYPDDEEDADNTFDLNQIISGMSTLAGPCGTYVIKDSQGLAVLPHHPHRHKHDDEKKLDTSTESHEPFLLEMGQTVQVTEFEDGVAKLARNAGYIVASSSSQLVKVGEPKDGACRLEGLLHTITSRGRDLQKTLDENRRVEESLREQLTEESQQEPTHPTISAKPLSPPSTPTDSGISQPILLETPTQQLQDLQIPEPISSKSIEFDHHGNAIYNSRYAANSPNSIDNSDLTGLIFRQANEDDDDNRIQQFVFGCGTTFFGGTAYSDRLFGEDAPQLPTTRGRAGSDSGAVQLERRSSPREIQAASSFDTTASSGSRTNWRTGMSGHRGLASSSRTSRNTPSTTGARRFLYSAHTGVSRARPSPTSSPMQSNYSWAE